MTPGRYSGRFLLSQLTILTINLSLCKTKSKQLSYVCKIQVLGIHPVKNYKNVAESHQKSTFWQKILNPHIKILHKCGKLYHFHNYTTEITFLIKITIRHNYTINSVII